MEIHWQQQLKTNGGLLLSLEFYPCTFARQFVRGENKKKVEIGFYRKTHVEFHFHDNTFTELQQWHHTKWLLERQMKKNCLIFS